MVKIFVDTITPRVHYTFDFIFQLRGIEYELISEPDRMNEADLNYSNKTGGRLHISSSGILEASELYSGSIEKSTIDSIECVSFEGTADPVASVFYVLTRMEEYSDSSKDEHGRFRFLSSILNSFGWVEQAVCDRWAMFILDKLGVKTEKASCIGVPTFDIDNTYAYRLKEGKRKYLSIARDLSKLDSKRLRERKQVLSGEKDPYDTFEIIRACGLKRPAAKVFWLLKSGEKFDRNVEVNHPAHQKLIREMSEAVSVNIHPSYSSFLKPEQISKEKETLEQITGTSVNASRQHFLRMQLPQTYRNLIEAGITNDYTMGFAENVGFRAGTAHPHFWFDLERNEKTGLKVHPFVYMDGTLNEYMRLSVAEAKERIDMLYKEVNNYGGQFIFIWHNETIGDYGIWKGWKEVFDYTLNLFNE